MAEMELTRSGRTRMSQAVDVNDIKDTTAEISMEKGHGEDTMNSFLRANFIGILKPFADHVEDLQKTVNQIGADLQKTTGKTNGNSALIDEHGEKLTSILQNLGRTTKQATATQGDLERLATEKVMLEEEQKRTKAELKDAEERLQAAQSAIAELQTGLKGTRTSVGKLREGLGKLERDTAARTWPCIEQLGSDLRNLDSAHSTTAQILQDLKTFSDNFHQAFQVFEEENDQRQVGHDRKFEHVEGQFTELERALKDVRNVSQLQTEHLNNIDGTIGPMKLRLDNLEVAREEAKRRLNELERLATDLKVTTSTLGLDVATLMNFYNEAKSGEDIFEVVSSIERNVSQNTENIRHLLETVDEQMGSNRQGANRTSNLEKAVQKLQDLTQRISDRVGLTDGLDGGGGGGGARSRSPSVTSGGNGSYEYKDANAAAAAKMPAAVLRAIDKMSLAARQKRAIDTINEHSRELANASLNLKKTACHLDSTELRVSSLESRMDRADEEVKRLGASLDLSHEYWKGLSRGLKEMNQKVNMDGEVLPPRSALTKLPAISRPPSRQHAAAMTAR